LKIAFVNQPFDTICRPTRIQWAPALIGWPSGLPNQPRCLFTGSRTPTPIVTSRSGTVPETVINGTTGFVVEKNNVEELSNALLLLLNDDERREAIGRGGPPPGHAAFTWDAIAEGMRKRYETLVRAGDEVA
jgi:glycosyltransferase involved in cell wall biosynthesis